jgi:hypothetical protein
MPSLLKVTHYGSAMLALLGGCGGDAPAPELAQAGLRGSFPEQAAAEGRVLEFSSVASAPAVADVQLRVGALSFDAHFDYVQGQVLTDGHGLALDHEAHALLRGALEALLNEPPVAEPTAGTSDLDEPSVVIPTFERRALYGTLVVWAESGGIPVLQKTFALPGASQGGLTDKSLGDDGVTCITRGESYEVSFNYGSSSTGGISVEDRLVTADSQSCNGLCGPACVLLTPFQSWTLDCLEHDECCAETDGGPDCWVPLGECGDEYERAVSDFLLGLDPFASHCGG